MKLVGTHATATPKSIVDALGNPITAGLGTPPEADHTFAHDPDRPTCRDFGQYAEWRRSKCKPRDYENFAERVEDVDQAIHEFVGEVAELGEAVLMLGNDLLLTEVGRKKLIDEIGDIFFCGFWVLDSWGCNPFLLPGTPAPDDFTPAGELEHAQLIRDRLFKDDRDLNDEEYDAINDALRGLSLQMGVLSGLLCNSFKKARWQGREQDVKQQATRVVNVLIVAVHVLTFAGALASDALARNIEKLDARYPRGYAGAGGGNRTGKGA